MKKFAALALLATAAAAAWCPALAADVGVSIDISQPGVYGRIDIGRFPQPQVVVRQPVIIGRPVAVQQEPVYLWVPPGHRQNWRRHCHEYRACGVPVYFVQDRWYGEHVRPHAQGRDGGREDFRADRREDRREDRHEGRRDEGRAEGRGHDK
jgi:hypothetical protein